MYLFALSFRKIRKEFLWFATRILWEWIKMKLISFLFHHISALSTGFYEILELLCMKITNITYSSFCRQKENEIVSKSVGILAIKIKTSWRESVWNHEIHAAWYIKIAVEFEYEKHQKRQRRGCILMRSTSSSCSPFLLFPNLLHAWN